MFSRLKELFASKPSYRIVEMSVPMIKPDGTPWTEAEAAKLRNITAVRIRDALSVGFDPNAKASPEKALAIPHPSTQTSILARALVKRARGLTVQECYRVLADKNLFSNDLDRRLLEARRLVDALGLTVETTHEGEGKTRHKRYSVRRVTHPCKIAAVLDKLTKGPVKRA